MSNSRPRIVRFTGPPTADGKFLEIGFTPDEREVLINVPAAGDDTAHHIVFSPDQARNLARLLLRKADECKP